MKRLQLFLISSILILGCTSHSDQTGDHDETNETKKEELSVYNLDPDTYISKEFGIFDLVNDDLEIIRMETCVDCFISHPLNIIIEDEFILVGSLTGSMKPGELLKFSRDGDFQYKIGKGGRGPGEHVGWEPRKVRYYQEDSTVMVYWGGGHSTIQLFEINGDFKGQIDFPYKWLAKTVERWSDSIWFETGYDDWGNVLGMNIPEDSIRFVLFSQHGDIIQKIPRTNFPPINELQEVAITKVSMPYQYHSTWKFNLRGNDTLFSIVNKELKADAILATPAAEFPLKIRVLRETDSFLMLNAIKSITTTGKDWTSERFLILLDKSTKKSYSIKLLDDVFFILDDFNRYDGDFMEKHFEWKDDRLTFAISANEWMQRAEQMDTSKLRPKIRDKLKILEGLKEDDNPIVFTFTLKDKISVE